ncbi:MAG: hypothetical protein ACLQBD_26685 [Syntrophobacteraceae bacterium]
MAKATVVKSDKDWEAESDAHTLARAKEIMADEKRLKAAIAAAKRLADELEKEHKHIKEVGGGDLTAKMYPKMKDTDKDGK